MFKKTAFVATTAAGLLMLGSPAFAWEGDDIEVNEYHSNDTYTAQYGLINVNDVLNDNNIGICDNNVGAQIGDLLNGVSVPVLSPDANSAGFNITEKTCVAEAQQTEY
ncbi:hypothetical protein FHU38_000724 [Saccharomonospora amisosensis]|uniref:Uncharacterized protein n=1 Tax=Saccharomonospora amisosensis TaxID=1128677 RepID=A0A7X5ULU5_9PSEU|nr:hypothetical protein [Saccharomonospora amisosensis]NIJ10380.1 hypothetical protein [Saccharomonospora amisosensis]